MLKSRRIFFSLAALIVGTFACSIPAGQPPSSNPTPDLALTITAQALLLQTSSNNQPPATASFTPGVPAAAISTDTPTSTATITLTTTLSIPLLTVSEDTNCRSGPSKEFGYLGVLLKDQTAEVVGKNTPTNYWIIKTPAGSGTCWLWGRYATVTGDTSKLQEYALPPTPTPSIPPVPKNLQANKVCTANGPNYDLSGSISWEDGPSEQGYRIYVDGLLFTSVGANVITVAIPPRLLAPGGSIKMAVEAFSSAGASAQKSVDIVCP